MSISRLMIFERLSVQVIKGTRKVFGCLKFISQSIENKQSSSIDGAAHKKKTDDIQRSIKQLMFSLSQHLI